ncbi:cisplatin damage response ATP-dependent DNA ligase [Oharaeibacter diazotrophicus]|uniref:DNA ligase (ATP) n=1 Tax=Oharaeibacter diazotrophicus TaxID=1920512 RepID=A0A4R6R8V6_9HYPH|nr:cisplatin damage response ATP-dependent DNA ligase [Oharaeibacter diazotrophicus]TDP82473.1 DNA ligase-1 [Oharaeibacter diazotrophicus]BBE72764.1 ATP-dependent DNA ligase [Pleomorphomonas sp. SM30]GLS76801.1 ATP-dependent DNA ligase [Oharaeibacter diazotrophicus]
MNRFAALLDALAYEPRRNAKLALVERYLRETPDPDRGFGLAALTGGLDLPNAKPGLVRALIAERTDPVLFALSYDYVGDLSETVALMWPGPAARPNEPPPALAEVVGALATASRTEIPRLLSRWLDLLDEAGRFALLKLVTGGLRIGVSARLAKTALARLGGREADEVEEVWHGLAPPYEALFAWLEGRADRPDAVDAAPFRTPMLAHPLEPRDTEGLDPALFRAEWKWDGIRVQAAAGRGRDGRRIARLFSRSGDDVSAAFPDVVERLGFDGAIDGELLILQDGRVQPFATLQQRLNRKSVTPKLLSEMPAGIRAYDLLAEGGEDLRPLPFTERRARLEALVARLADPMIDLSPLVPFATWDDLAAARADPAGHGAGADADAVEGVMIKRAAAPYLPGRVRGEWFKWKRDPFEVDAVLMYAQRGHGKRSSFYSDYTFGVWRAGPEGRELVPVGKAYFGFTDEELKEIDRFVRQNTVARFGPVREVVHEETAGLVLQVAFEGLARSARHRSGLAMRFPRIARLRWDKKPAEADGIETLTALLPAEG